MSLTGPVLVTGGTGFLGSHLTARLVQEGVAVTITTTADRPRSWLPEGVRVRAVDLEAPDQIDTLCAEGRFKTIFHLAALGVRAEDQRWNSAAAVNVLAGAALARAAMRSELARFVHVGSALEYASSEGPASESQPLVPINWYGATKAAGWLLLDQLSREEGLPLVTVRPYPFYGPREVETKLVPYVCLRALAREPIQVTLGMQRRDYTYVEDIVEGIVLAARQQTQRSIYNLGNGTEGAATVRELVERILDLAGAPRELARFGAVGQSRPESPALIADAARAHLELGWKPKVSLEEGLARTLRWYDASRQLT